ncbi:MAG: 4-alpha-glucanotransferase [Candidatus Aminicenantia bacterium]
MRGSGVLAHITSLPSPFGIGDIGHPSFWFVNLLDFLKQSYWQILPINPTDPFFGNSPYTSDSAFAGNIILISPESLYEYGYLSREALEISENFPFKRVDYEKVSSFKIKILERAYERFKEKKKEMDEFEEFCERENYWLEDYALFRVLKKLNKYRAWNEWEEEFAGRKERALRKVREELKKEIDKVKFSQFIFFRQWVILRKYCEKRGIKIIGDLSFYVSFDSADVWANPDIFKLQEDRKPAFVAGVPPDNFSDVPQLWGNPVYNWDVLKKRNYDWWFLRIEKALKLYDMIRLDHFRGFAAYWEIPYGEKSSTKGRWVKGHGEDFFKKLFERFPNAPLIAEDLGIITEDVRTLLKKFNIPGTKVLHFAFIEDNPENSYLPHNYERNFVVYTGTHDNNTTKGWFEKELDKDGKERVRKYLSREVSSENISWELIRLAMQSVAKISIIPMQDILSLGEEARMNKPGTRDGNWTWRFGEEDVREEFKKRLLELTEIYGRARK